MLDSTRPVDALDRIGEGLFGLDPEGRFAYINRRAQVLLERVLGLLRDECVKDGKGPLFEKVKGMLVGPEGEDPVYKPIAEALGEPVDGFKVKVHRLRKRFGQILREQIAETVERVDEVDEEIDFLLRALAVPEP